MVCDAAKLALLAKAPVVKQTPEGNVSSRLFILDFNYLLAAFSCVGKVDGVYKQKCASLFVVCNNEEATFLSCPHGLMYDGTTAKCRKEVCVINSIFSVLKSSRRR